MQDAVRRAIDDAKVLVPLAASAYDQAYAQLEAPGDHSPAELDAIVRDASWADAHLGPAALARSNHYLAEMHVECRDCPPMALQSYSLTWGDFIPNVQAYVWPARDEDGQTHIHVCSAVNGARELEMTDARALEVGFLVAVVLAEDAATRCFIADLAARNLDVSEASEVIDQFIDSPAARRVACRRVEQVAWFTGLVVTDCE